MILFFAFGKLWNIIECRKCGDFANACYYMDECLDMDDEANKMLCSHGLVCPSCSDGRQNQDETGIDCGGPCDACPTCSDGVQNQGEADIDCGGPCDACGKKTVELIRLIELDKY